VQETLKSLAALVSLGCAKNLVDSEVMVSQLIDMGYEMSENPAEASLILVNTCGFLESAVQEAIETILDLSRHKTGGSCKHLVAAGCMVQRYGKKLLALMPEVDCFVGTEYCYDLRKILSAHQEDGARRLWISTPRFLLHSDLPRSRSTPFYTAYLKIAEGCSNRCSYCLIPNLRGPYRSRSIEDILTEARRLAADGVKEINLIAQDTTAFGSDFGDPNAVIRLIESLDTVDGIAWIRLLYAYPDRINATLLRTLAQSEKTVPYLDVPLQHCVPRVLQAMGRPTPSGGPKALIELIRLHLPKSAIRTSFIVGFPGESNDDFEALVEFVETVEFDHLGVFAFSPEAGTRAARLPDQIDEKTKEERREILLAAQRPVSKRRLGLRLGEMVAVLVEGLHPESDLLLSGRIATQAPEVDGNVIITKGQANVGEIVSARITAVHDYDLEAELCGCS
jgi:ribosomal protein S12 methylthiotransferase